MLPAEPDILKNILWNQTKSQGLLLFFLDCVNHKVWNKPRERAGLVKNE